MRMVVTRKVFVLLSVLVFFISVKYVFFQNQYTPPISVSQQNVTSQSSLSFRDRLLSGITLKCPIREGHSEVELLLKKYERFLKPLENYASFHDTLRKSPSTRTLVWWCGSFAYCGGLGNRIRSITYVLLLAMFSRRRIVIVWPNHSEGDFLHPYTINWEDRMISNHLKMSASGTLKYNDFIVRHHFKIYTLTNSTIDKTKKTMESYMRIIASNESNVILSTNVMPNALLDPKRNGNNPKWLMDEMQLHGFLNLSNIELDEMIGIAFRYLFKLDDVVLERTSAAAEMLGLNHLPYVAIHVRTGFAKMPHLDEVRRHRRFMRLDSEWKRALHCAINAAGELSGKNKTCIFLATDSNQLKQMALNQYGTRIRTLNDVLIHVDNLKKKPHPLTAEEKEGFIVMWIDFLLIAQARIVVRGDSGFSRAAGLLCGKYYGSRTLREIDKCS